MQIQSAKRGSAATKNNKSNRNLTIVAVESVNFRGTAWNARSDEESIVLARAEDNVCEDVSDGIPAETFLAEQAAKVLDGRVADAGAHLQADDVALHHVDAPEKAGEPRRIRGLGERVPFQDDVLVAVGRISVEAVRQVEPRGEGLGVEIEDVGAKEVAQYGRRAGAERRVAGGDVREGRDDVAAELVGTPVVLVIYVRESVATPVADLGPLEELVDGGDWTDSILGVLHPPRRHASVEHCVQAKENDKKHQQGQDMLNWKNNDIQAKQDKKGLFEPRLTSNRYSKDELQRFLDVQSPLFGNVSGALDPPPRGIWELVAQLPVLRLGAARRTVPVLLQVRQVHDLPRLFHPQLVQLTLLVVGPEDLGPQRRGILKGEGPDVPPVRRKGELLAPVRVRGEDAVLRQALVGLGEG